MERVGREGGGKVLSRVCVQEGCLCHVRDHYSVEGIGLMSGAVGVRNRFWIRLSTR